MYEDSVRTITTGLWLGLIPLLIGYFVYWTGNSEVDKRRTILFGWVIPRYLIGTAIITLGSILVTSSKEQIGDFCGRLTENANLIAGVSSYIAVALAYVYLFAFRLRAKNRELQEGEGAAPVRVTL